MEELAELAKGVSKELRGKGDHVSILEELADNQIGIWYVQEICNISDEELNKAVEVKMDRLRNILIEKGYYA